MKCSSAQPRCLPYCVLTGTGLVGFSIECPTLFAHGNTTCRLQLPKKQQAKGGDMDEAVPPRPLCDKNVRHFLIAVVSIYSYKCSCARDKVLNPGVEDFQ